MNMTDQSSIDAVAASLINAPEAVETPEQEETLDADGVPEDAETEEVEAQAEDEAEPLEVEAEDEAEEYDDQEAEAVVEEQEAPLYTVKVDGKVQHVTLDELQRGYSGQAYIQQNLEHLANAKKQMQDQFQEMQSERQLLSQLRQKAEAGESFAPPKPPSRELFNTDPIGFMEAKLAHEDAMEAYQQDQQKLSQMDQRDRALQEQQHNLHLQAEMQALQRAIPEFADPQKAPAYKDKLVRAGTNYYGFTPDELQSEADSRRIQVLNDAMKWREMQEAKGAVRQKAEGSRPVIKPGVKRTEKTSVRKRQQAAASKMSKTGSVDDVAAFLLS